jgi:hypothetical protein
MFKIADLFKSNPVSSNGELQSLVDANTEDMDLASVETKVGTKSTPVKPKTLYYSELTIQCKIQSNLVLTTTVPVRIEDCTKIWIRFKKWLHTKYTPYHTFTHRGLDKLTNGETTVSRDNIVGYSIRIIKDGTPRIKNV